MSRIVFLDTETTGLDPDSEQVFEIAVVREDGSYKTWRLEPDPPTVADMHPKAAEVNRYHERTAFPNWKWDAKYEDTDDVWEGVLSEVFAELDGAHIVGAVPDFDTRFLKALFDRWQMTPPKWHYHLIDIESMIVGYFASTGVEFPLPGDSEALSLALGIHPRERHTALGDAEWVMRMYEEMTGGAYRELNRLENTDDVISTHRRGACIGDTCTIHNRSDHHMRSCPQNWRMDRAIMERICSHGIGHPDPDDTTEDTVHGCDGCCAGVAP